MKKRFIYFLCKIKLYKFAYKISPALAMHWEMEQQLEKIEKGLIEAGIVINKLKQE